MVYLLVVREVEPRKFGFASTIDLEWDLVILLFLVSVSETFETFGNFIKVRFFFFKRKMLGFACKCVGQLGKKKS